MQLNTQKKSKHNLRVNFSLRKEIFFVTLGSLLGAFTMFVPRIILDLTIGTQYYIVWLVFAKIVNSSSPTTGAVIHFFVATIIGIITGIVLYKGNFLNISKISNGLIAIGENGQIVPILASSWEETKSGLEYRFHLRTNLYWSDGEKFTAADINISLFFDAA